MICASGYELVAVVHSVVVGNSLPSAEATLRAQLDALRKDRDLSFRGQASELNVALATLTGFHYGRRPLSDELKVAARRTYPQLIPLLPELSLTWLRDAAPAAPVAGQKPPPAEVATGPPKRRS